MRVSAFGRGYLLLELLLVLFGVAAAISIRLERSRAARAGAFLAAAAVLLVPGAAGHAAQTSPRPLALGLDWLHLAAGSLWLGGLVSFLVRPPDRRAVRRFSIRALASVALLAGTGAGAAALRLPTVSSLWQTSYGTAILVKTALLAAATAAAAVNVRRPALGRGLLAAETLLVAAAVAGAATLSSLPPPPREVARVGPTSARVGPGPAAAAVEQDGYRLVVRISPNRIATANAVSLRLTHRGAPVHGAAVTATLTMLDMEMPTQAFRLAEARPGVYARSTAALAMVGRWGLALRVTPPGARAFTVVLVDRAGG
jgi:copper transport protein